MMTIIEYKDATLEYIHELCDNVSEQDKDKIIKECNISFNRLIITKLPIRKKLLLAGYIYEEYQIYLPLLIKKILLQ